MAGEEEEEGEEGRRPIEWGRRFFGIGVTAGEPGGIGGGHCVRECGDGHEDAGGGGDVEGEIEAGEVGEGEEVGPEAKKEAGESGEGGGDHGVFGEEVGVVEGFEEGDLDGLVADAELVAGPGDLDEGEEEAGEQPEVALGVWGGGGIAGSWVGMVPSEGGSRENGESERPGVNGTTRRSVRRSHCFGEAITHRRVRGCSAKAKSL